jgi:hypothetical protein
VDLALASQPWAPGDDVVEADDEADAAAWASVWRAGPSPLLPAISPTAKGAVQITARTATAEIAVV